MDKKNKIINLVVCKLISLLGGVPVSFDYKGDKGHRQVHASHFLHYKPFEQTFVVDWSNKEIELFGDKVFTEKIYEKN